MYQPLNAAEEKRFDRAYPAHKGHKRVMLPMLGLSYDAYCMDCSTALRMTIAAAMVADLDEEDPTLTAIKHVPVQCSGIKDDRFPQECPRCHGPAYIGGNNNVDCKNKCR